MLCKVCGEEKEEQDFYPRNRSTCKKCYARRAYRSRKARGLATSQIETKEAMRARNLKYHYGITPEKFVILSEAQGGRCAICKRKRKLCVDHDHETKRIRGLLCSPCNQAIGLLQHDAATLKEAIAYLS